MTRHSKHEKMAFVRVKLGNGDLLFIVRFHELESTLVCLPSIGNIGISNKCAASMFLIVLQEIRRSDPLTLITTEPDPSFLARDTLNFGSSGHLSRLHIGLVDLGEVRVPESGHDLVENRVVGRSQSGIPQTVGRQKQSVWGLGLSSGRRHCGRKLASKRTRDVRSEREEVLKAGGDDCIGIERIGI